MNYLKIKYDQSSITKSINAPVLEELKKYGITMEETKENYFSPLNEKVTSQNY